MQYMVLSLQMFNKHVIDVYLHSLSNLACEHCIHQPLVSGPSVLQAEGHDLMTIDPP